MRGKHINPKYFRPIGHLTAESQEPFNNNPPQALGSGAAFFGPGTSPGGGGLTAGALNGRSHLLEAHSGVPNARAGGAALSPHDQAHHLVQ